MKKPIQITIPAKHFIVCAVFSLFFHPLFSQIVDLGGSVFTLRSADSIRKLQNSPKPINYFKSEDVFKFDYRATSRSTKSVNTFEYQQNSTQGNQNKGSASLYDYSAVINDSTIRWQPGDSLIKSDDTTIIIERLDDWNQIKEPSHTGFGYYAGLNRQSYNQDLMQYFRALTTFAIEADIMVRSFQITLGASFGGGRVYDSLLYNNWQWQPMTNLNTRNYAITLGYSVFEYKIFRVVPFVGYQKMDLKLRPQSFFEVPDDISPWIKSNNVTTFGLNLFVMHNTITKSGANAIGAGIKISYAYSIADFPGMSGSFHQVKILTGFMLRNTKLISRKVK